MATPVSSVSGGGATWHRVTSTVDSREEEIWLGTVTTTGGSTITVTYSGSVGSIICELDAQEFASSTGSTTTWSADSAGNSHNDGSSTNVTFPSLSASGMGELYVGYGFVQNTAVAGSTSGFTYDVTSPNNELYVFNPSVAGTVNPTATQKVAGYSLTVGVLLKATVPASATTTTASTWDQLSAGSIPLNINDASTTSGVTTNTSYVYGDLLFGGTAPVEQISGSTATFLVTNPTGVQAVFSSSGAVLEKAIYSTYGVRTIQFGSIVTPFGFQGSYTDSTGLIYLINRYYDPTTDQFMSVDPIVDQTGQPYVYTNDNPLNATDPLGLAAAALMDSGKVTAKEAVRVTVAMAIDALRSEGVSISADVMKQIAKALLTDLEKPSRHISKSEIRSLEISLAATYSHVGETLGFLSTMATGLNDLENGHTIWYAVADTGISAGGAMAGGAIGGTACGGPLDPVDAGCVVVGAAIGSNLGPATVNAAIALYKDIFH